MNTITYGNLYMEFPAKILTIEKLHITEELNQHGTAKASLTVFSREEYRFIDSIRHDSVIKIILNKNCEDDCIFCGILQNITVKKLEQVYHVELEIKSVTYLLNVKSKRRSFQNMDNRYENLFNTVVKADYPEAVVFDNASEGLSQGCSIIQYDETDWQFIKRMAANLSAKVLPNVKNPYPTVAIGVFAGDSHAETTTSYKLISNNDIYLESELNYNGWLTEDTLNYRFKSTNEYNIYDRIEYEQLQFKIFKKETFLENAYIVFIYYLVKENGLQALPIVNNNILGASILGTILDIKIDRVKLHLSIDEEQSIDEAYWYKYETAYTSEGQTGFYSMPQKGDMVELYTPTEYVEDAYVRTVRRYDGDYNLKTQEPNIKYYGNIHKKELMLAPSELQVTARNGLILLNMDNQEGIEFSSSSDINIHTQAEAGIYGKKIGIRSMNKIRLATSHSSIVINAEINMKADGGVSL